MIPGFLLQNENSGPRGPKGKSLSFIDRTIKGMVSFVSVTFLQWQLSGRKGFLQKRDSRVKVIFMLLYLILISLVHAVFLQFILFFILFFLSISSRVDVFPFYRKIILVGFFFGFLIFAPALLNIFAPGKPVLTLFRFSGARHFWIYTVPPEIAITREGILLVGRLTLRVINSVTLVMLVVSTTTFERVVKSLSFLGLPDLFLLTLTLSYRFIFILSQTVAGTYTAMKVRWWNRGTGGQAGNLVAGRIGYLFRKSWNHYEMVWQSMEARGFTGKVNFCYFDRPGLADYLFSACYTVIFIVFVLFNDGMNVIL